MDWPNEPFSTSPRKVRYCCQSGASSPSWRRKAMTSASLPRAPISSEAGSPGRTRSRRKATIVIPMSAGMSWIIRRRKNSRKVIGSQRDGIYGRGAWPPAIGLLHDHVFQPPVRGRQHFKALHIVAVGIGRALVVEEDERCAVMDDLLHLLEHLLPLGAIHRHPLLVVELVQPIALPF